MRRIARRNWSGDLPIMSIFPSLPADLQLPDLFMRFPNSVAPLLEYHDRLLRDRSPLKVADRELIAAFVSGLNACDYCHGAHVIAAGAFGIDEGLIDTLMQGVDAAPVDERLKPVLAYVEKLTRTPSKIGPSDAQKVYDAGWDEQALFDAISICALFNLMNRIVSGSGITLDPRLRPADEIEARRKRMAQPRHDPYEAEPSYSKLPQLWRDQARTDKSRA